MMRCTWHGEPVEEIAVVAGNATLGELLEARAERLVDGRVSSVAGPATLFHRSHGVAFVPEPIGHFELADHLEPGHLMGRVVHPTPGWIVSVSPVTANERTIGLNHSIRARCDADGLFCLSGLPDEDVDVSVWRTIRHSDGLQIDLLRRDLPHRIRIGRRPVWLELGPEQGRDR